MICYRDKTFCPFFETCSSAKGCDRPLTAEVVAAAERAGLPIARYVSKPGCHSAATPPARATLGDYADLAANS